MSLFAKLMGNSTLSVAPPVAAAPAPGASTEGSGGDGLTPDRIETALQAAKAEGHAEGEAAGASAERARTAAVFASDAGKANMTMGAWMLANNPTATAETIIAQLGTMPAAAAAAAPAAPAAVTTPLAETPKVDLNGGAPGANADDGAPKAEDSNKMWDDIQGVVATSRNGVTLATGGTTLRPTGH